MPSSFLDEITAEIGVQVENLQVFEDPHKRCGLNTSYPRTTKPALRTKTSKASARWKAQPKSQTALEEVKTKSLVMPSRRKSLSRELRDGDLISLLVADGPGPSSRDAQPPDWKGRQLERSTPLSLPNSHWGSMIDDHEAAKRRATEEKNASPRKPTRQISVNMVSLKAMGLTKEGVEHKA